ncbi:MAG: hypothetical protein WC734_06260 [Patescibacteria group bacterium]|jgi:hypothetical protein
MSTDKNEQKTIRAIADVKKGAQDEFTLSSGVVLRAMKANPLVLINVMARYVRPKPPTFFMEAMGREMENPDDPDYIERVKAWEIESNSQVLNALILLGTELVSVPKGLSKPSEDKWLNKYRVLDMPVHPDNEDWRYLTWVKFVAAPDESDLSVIQDAVGRLSGIAEVDVKSAEQFPGSGS